MKVPQEITIKTKEYVEIIAKLNLYIASYGVIWVHNYMDNIPLRYRKVNGRNAGAYIVGKICDEYEVTEHDLYHGKGRKNLTEPRQVLCTLVAKYLNYSHKEIADYFGRTRTFASRGIQVVTTRVEENHPFDKEMVTRFKKLDSLVSAYMSFSPSKSTKR